MTGILRPKEGLSGLPELKKTADVQVSVPDSKELARAVLDTVGTLENTETAVEMGNVAEEQSGASEHRAGGGAQTGVVEPGVKFDFNMEESDESLMLIRNQVTSSIEKLWKILEREQLAAKTAGKLSDKLLQDFVAERRRLHQLLGSLANKTFVELKEILAKLINQIGFRVKK